MKNLSIVLGLLLILIGLIQGGKYIQDYNILTHYGKGFVWGSGFFIIIGAILLIFGLKKRINSKKKLD